eukprot:TRINITY_DN8128_c0_g1_i12.p2 TRINITY_DN8128_c0_g1~~TRINITY_DN8128_c0_g1_i12.p2  ORF type:complete len:462 (+),score=66.67 TRINITY_DN8128_c0_g1_i12:41-1426(+)
MLKTAATLLVIAVAGSYVSAQSCPSSPNLNRLAGMFNITRGNSAVDANATRSFCPSKTSCCDENARKALQSQWEAINQNISEMTYRFDYYLKQATQEILDNNTKTIVLDVWLKASKYFAALRDRNASEQVKGFIPIFHYAEKEVADLFLNFTNTSLQFQIERKRCIDAALSHLSGIMCMACEGQESIANGDFITVDEDAKNIRVKVKKDSCLNVQAVCQPYLDTRYNIALMVTLINSIDTLMKAKEDLYNLEFLPSDADNPGRFYTLLINLNNPFLTDNFTYPWECQQNETHCNFLCNDIFANTTLDIARLIGYDNILNIIQNIKNPPVFAEEEEGEWVEEANMNTTVNSTDTTTLPPPPLPTWVLRFDYGDAGIESTGYSNDLGIKVESDFAREVNLDEMSGVLLSFNMLLLVIVTFFVSLQEHVQREVSFQSPLHQLIHLYLPHHIYAQFSYNIRSTSQ